MINLYSLSYAVCVAEQKSFNAASKILGMNQSILSRRIRALEDEIGVCLFERNHAGVRETAAGRKFLSDIRPILRNLEHATQSAQRAGKGEIGEIRIGVQISLASDFMRGLIQDFRRTHPSVSLHFVDSFDGGIISQLNEHAVDVLFRTLPAAEIDLHQQLLWNSRAYVVMPETHELVHKRTISWEDLKNEHFIARPNTASEVVVCRHFQERGWKPSIEEHQLSREDLLELTSMGLGIMVTSPCASAPSGRKLVARPLARREGKIECYGLWSDQNDNPAFRRFLSLARSRSTAAH